MSLNPRTRTGLRPIRRGHSAASSVVPLFVRGPSLPVVEEAFDRPQNLIVVREAGGPWDSFTLGFYRDIKHYAESADLPAEVAIQ